MKQTEEVEVSWIIVTYKFVLGLIETLSGLAMAILGKQIMAQYSFRLAQELMEEPHDLIARVSIGIVPNLFSHSTYVIASLIVLGLIKMAGAIGLVKKQNWGVDLLVGMTLIMLPFQVVSLVLHPNLFNCLYIAVGVVIALFLIQFKPKAWISRVWRKDFLR